MSLIAAALTESLEGLASVFPRNQLAYLSLVTKNERELCNALAWRLHERFLSDSDTQVVREWKRRDIAVLRRHNPVALVEAKAAMTFDLVKGRERVYPSREVQSDIEKLRQVDFEGERYVLPFFTRYHQLPRHEFDAAMPYIGGMRRHGVIDDDSINVGFGRLAAAIGNPPVVCCGEIQAGSAFGVEVSVLYWLMAVPG